MTSSATRFQTPLHSWNLHHGARMVESDGWQLPACYTTVEEEVRAARAGAGLTDLSAFAKLRWQGRGVQEKLGSLLGDGPASRVHGVSALASGAVTACRLTHDHALLLSSSTNPAQLRELVGKDSFPGVVQSDATSDYAGFALLGPRLEEWLRRMPLFDLPPEALLEACCAETNIAGVHGLLIRPADRSLPMVQVYAAWDVGEFLWETLLHAGERLGAVPLGIDAWKQLACHAPEV